MDRNKKTINELNRSCDMLSILIIDKAGAIRRIFCPFKVIHRRITPYSNEKKILYVDRIKISDDLLMLYVVDKAEYPYYLFTIIL